MGLSVNDNKERVNITDNNSYINIKEEEGFVKKIKKTENRNNYTTITKKEWEDISGETYYKKTFTHGGARNNAGRKPLHRNISIRVTIKEKDLINLLRQNSIDPELILKNFNIMAN